MIRYRLVAAAVAALGIVAVAPAQVAPLINEYVANHTGTDTHEYVEIFASPNSNLSSLTILQIEGDTTGAGVVDTVLAVGTTDAGGFWVSSFLGNEFENGTMTLMLVSDFTGSDGQDLDTNNDGTFDLTPWSSIVGALGIYDGGTGDWNYAAVTLNPDFDGGTLTVGGASRLPNGVNTNTIADWTRNDFDGMGLPGFVGTPDAGEALNTPGTTNSPVPEPATMVALIAGLGALMARRRR